MFWNNVVFWTKTIMTKWWHLLCNLQFSGPISNSHNVFSVKSKILICVNDNAFVFFKWQKSHYPTATICCLSFRARSSKSELSKISELTNRWIKNSKNVLLIKLFCFYSDCDETWWSCNTHGYYKFTKFHHNWNKNKKVLLIAHFLNSWSLKYTGPLLVCLYGIS